MQLVHYTAEYLYAEPETTFYTSDEEARRWVREARQEEIRERTGYHRAAQLDKVGSGIAGGWASDWNGEEQTSLVDSEVPQVRQAARRYERLWELLRTGQITGQQYDEYVSRVFEDTGLDEREAELEYREVPVKRVESERELSRWLRRDEIAEWVEEKRRTEGDQSRVDGDYWGAGPTAEKRWLDAQIAQLRINAQELVADGRRKGVNVKPLTDPQVAAIKRQAESLRHRHNFKRYVEALKCDPEMQGTDFAEAFEAAQKWRLANKLSYAVATRKLKAIHERRWVKGDENWIGVEGLIAA